MDEASAPREETCEPEETPEPEATAPSPSAAARLLAVVARSFSYFFVFSALLSLLGFLGSAGFLLDLVCHFRLQYAVFQAGCLPLFLGARRWILASAAGLICLVNFLCILPVYREAGGPLPRPDAPRLRVLLANVHTGNRDHDALASVVREFAPQVVGLVEVDETWLQGLEPVLKAFPHRVEQPRKDNFGMALYSKLPLRRAGVRYVGKAGVPSVFARVRWDGWPLRIALTHPLPPTSRRGHGLRNGQLEQLAAALEESKTSLLVMGDLNVSPWSAHFRRFRDRLDLLDTRQGHGVHPTWPVGKPILLIPVDHCLITADLAAVDRETGPDIGSDHYPVLVTIARRP